MEFYLTNFIADRFDTGSKRIAKVPLKLRYTVNIYSILMISIHGIKCNLFNITFHVDTICRTGTNVEINPRFLFKLLVWGNTPCHPVYFPQ